MKPKRIIISGAAILLTVLAVWFARSKVHIAGPSPAIDFAENYYAALKAGNVSGVLGMYEQSIPTGPTDSLPRLLLTMQSSHGDVVSAELQSGNLTPKDDLACYWLTYTVTRISAKTVENLLLCPQDSGQSFGIAGHAILNPVTNQHISFGTTLRTQTVSFGNAP